jgi:hypothetical protein
MITILKNLFQITLKFNKKFKDNISQMINQSKINMPFLIIYSHIYKNLNNKFNLSVSIIWLKFYPTLSPQIHWIYMHFFHRNTVIKILKILFKNRNFFPQNQNSSIFLVR